ncbi:hypothetical protein F5Y16DRAFT_107906 [Xylariaceae sp. FL0255]|nr:hypothetical protein F5Y16DRAFT_107906 [Xylariaceae sp. FL0255]
MVEEFSVRKFTKITDRLPALSGLAKAMDRTRLGKYYASMRGVDLPQSLLWYTSAMFRDPDESMMPLPYVGPTWSWISTTG